MMKLKRVNNGNVIDITHFLLNDEQRRYMISPLNFLESVKGEKNCWPLIIYNDDIPVGFFAYGIIEDVYVIAGFMIDLDHQRKGYGKKAMQILINKIKKDKNHSKISLNVDEDNAVAIKLYESLGFKMQGISYFKIDEYAGTSTDVYRMVLEY